MGSIPEQRTVTGTMAPFSIDSLNARTVLTLYSNPCSDEIGGPVNERDKPLSYLE